MNIYAKGFVLWWDIVLRGLNPLSIYRAVGIGRLVTSPAKPSPSPSPSPSRSRSRINLIHKLMQINVIPILSMNI